MAPVVIVDDIDRYIDRYSDDYIIRYIDHYSDGYIDRYRDGYIDRCDACCLHVQAREAEAELQGAKGHAANGYKTGREDVARA